MTLRVACVYRSGLRRIRGIEYRYDRAYVEKLRAAVARNMATPHQFLCLTDRVEAGYDIPLERKWAGWWSKIELFRPGLLTTGPVVYIDLDTVICGAIDWMIPKGPGFAMQWYAGGAHPARWCSAFMSWQGDYSGIHARFTSDPRVWRGRYKAMPKKGDQAFIADYLREKGEIRRIDAGTPNAIGRLERPKTGMSLVYFKGSQKPHMFPDHRLIQEHWR